VGSDSILKKNLKIGTNALSKLNSINGYTYHYKPYKVTNGIDSNKIFYPDTFMHYGVVAEEVQKIMPYAVKTVENGRLAVDYIQLIPLLLDGVKESDKNHQQLKDNFDLLQARYNKLAESIDTTGGVFKLAPKKENSDFVLYQNSPNPFDKETAIKYELKGSYSSATIYIFDLSGVLKKTYASLSGSASITVKAGDLTAGMYIYDLVVDGKEIDVKRMILTN
jgi:hypothetical protein